MILYANGCSHTAAAEAVVPESFAVDDGRYGIDRRPHPENLKASWCTCLANDLGAELVCDAESGGSNARTIRTTKQWIESNTTDALLIIQWTTWEREEWLHNNTWYQVNASGKDWLPKELQQQYKQFVASIDWTAKTIQAHQLIKEFHEYLVTKKIKHIFFNGNMSFQGLDPVEWDNCYIGPYTDDLTFNKWLVSNGGQYVRPSNYHFNKSSHQLWAKFLLHLLNTQFKTLWT